MTGTPFASAVSVLDEGSKAAIAAVEAGALYLQLLLLPPFSLRDQWESGMPLVLRLIGSQLIKGWVKE